MSSPLRSACGLTAIELMVGLVLLGLLASLAIPGFRAQRAAWQLTSATNELLGSLMQARSQAIRLGDRVVVCRSAGQAQCDTAGAGGWEVGWLVFRDANRDGRVSAGDTLIARHPAQPSLSIQGNGQVAHAVHFKPSGDASAAGTIRVCSPGDALPAGQRERSLVLTLVGRVALERRPAPAADPSSCAGS